MRDPGEGHSMYRGPAEGPGCESTHVQKSGASRGGGTFLAFLGFLKMKSAQGQPQSDDCPLRGAALP